MNPLAPPFIPKEKEEVSPELSRNQRKNLRKREKAKSSGTHSQDRNQERSNAGTRTLLRNKEHKQAADYVSLSQPKTPKKMAQSLGIKVPTGADDARVEALLAAHAERAQYTSDVERLGREKAWDVMMLNSSTPVYWFSATNPNQLMYGAFTCDASGRINGPWHRVQFAILCDWARIVFWLATAYGAGWLFFKVRGQSSTIEMLKRLLKSYRR